VNLTKKHRVAVRLLKRLGLSTIRLEHADGYYQYQGWMTPLPGENGHAMIAKEGKVRAK
jgi:hypothetical protein